MSADAVMEDISIDYATPWNQRTPDFIAKRTTILGRGLPGTADSQTIAMVEALKDCAGEMQFSLNEQIKEQAAEITNLKLIGNTAVRDETNPQIEQLRKEEAVIRESLEKEVQKLRDDNKNGARALETSRQKVAALRSQLSFAAEKEAIIGKLWEQVAASEAAAASLKYAMELRTSNTDGGSKTPWGEMFTLKLGSLTPYYGRR